MNKFIFILGVVAKGGQLLKVLNLNLWGLGWPLGEDKDLRYVLFNNLIPER